MILIHQFGKTSLLIILVHFFNTVHCQNPSYQDPFKINQHIKSIETNKGVYNLAEQLSRQLGEPTAADSLERLINIIKSDTAYFSKNYRHFYQCLMNLYSFISDNKKSIEYEEKANLKSPPKIPTETIYDNIKILNAQEYIVTKFGDKQIILFNEAHNRGQIRAFISSLLPKLYELGYRHIGLEALSYYDFSLHDRGYPIKSSGYYIKEPAFAELIREGLSIGFHFFPYDDTSQVYNFSQREQTQAENIYKLAKSVYPEKVIVLGGYGHISKINVENKVMGCRLVELLKSSIPAVDCTTLIEYNNKEIEHPMYNYLSDTLMLDEPSVVLLNDEPFVSKEWKNGADVCVFLPRTNYDLTYPNWLKQNKIPYSIAIPDSLNSDNQFVKIFKKREIEEVNDKAIPLLQFMGSTNQKRFNAFLKPGEYLVYIYNGSGKIEYKSDLIIKH